MSNRRKYFVAIFLPLVHDAQYFMLNISAQAYGINNPAVLGSKFPITGAHSVLYRWATYPTRRVNKRRRIASKFLLFLISFFSMRRDAGTAHQSTRVARARQYLRGSQ